MNLNEYQELALRTRNRLPESERACYALGLAGEAGEAALAIFEEPEKLNKEIGDTLWYTATLAHVFGIKMGELAPFGIADFSQDWMIEDRGETMQERLLVLAGRSGTAADYVKKVVFHNHVCDAEKLRTLLSLVLTAMAGVAHTGGTNLDHIAKQNIAKLRARYPDGFSSEASANRKPTDI